MERVAKQVIARRKDLGMREGKMIAQGAHASLAVLRDGGGMDAERTRFSPRSSRRRRRWACALIVDAGKTEFHGVPTKTCCAVGPAWTDEVDAITGDLSLL